MVSFISYLLGSLALLLAIPVCMLVLEIFAALILPRNNSLIQQNNTRNQVAVLVPAHNESTGILSTLTDIKGQLQTGDRLIVIADNCVDDTALVATSAGVEVIKRDEPTKMGKGYALDFGLRQLRHDPPVT